MNKHLVNNTCNVMCNTCTATTYILYPFRTLLQASTDMHLLLQHAINHLKFSTCSKCQYYMHHNPSTVKPVLRDPCWERLSVLKHHIFLAEGPTFQYNWTCHQRPPVLRERPYINGQWGGLSRQVLPYIHEVGNKVSVSPPESIT